MLNLIWIFEYPLVLQVLMSKVDVGPLVNVNDFVSQSDVWVVMNAVSRLIVFDSGSAIDM